MKRFLNIGALALAILSTAALAATAAMVITADRGGDFPRYDGGIPGTPAPATVDYDAYIGSAHAGARGDCDCRPRRLYQRSYQSG